MVFKPQTFHGDNTTQGSEAHVEAAVAGALARAGTLDASNVVVTSSGPTIVLQGSVAFPQEVSEAGEIATAVAGAGRISNLIQSRQSDNVSRPKGS